MTPMHKWAFDVRAFPAGVDPLDAASYLVTAATQAAFEFDDQKRREFLSRMTMEMRCLQDHGDK